MLPITVSTRIDLFAWSDRASNNLWRVSASLAYASIVVYLNDKREARTEGDALDKRIRTTGRAAARVGTAVLYSDPPKFAVANPSLGSVATWPLAPDTRASVEAAGNVSVTRGRDLARERSAEPWCPAGSSSSVTPRTESTISASST
jgi:hypothetical protein